MRRGPSVLKAPSLPSGMGRTPSKNVRIVSICVQVCLGIFPLCSWNTANNSFLSVAIRQLFCLISYFFSLFGIFVTSSFDSYHISLLNSTAVHWHLQDRDNLFETYSSTPSLLLYTVLWILIRKCEIIISQAISQLGIDPPPSYLHVFWIKNCQTPSKSRLETHWI